MPRKPCLFLTGGTGFVGQHMAPALCVRFPGHHRVLLCRTNESTSNDGWEQENSELTDEHAIDRVIAKFRPEIVIHLAAQASVGSALGAAEETWRVNFCGSMALASALARHTTQGTFLFASTAEVYGRNMGKRPADEKTPPDPMNSYGASKLAAEQMLSDILPSNTRLIVTRAFNHSGPGQDERFVLPSFAAQIARIETGQVPARMMVGNLDSERDYLHVADVVDAYIRLVGAANHLEARMVVNVASGRAWKISSLLAAMRDMAIKPFEIINDPARMRASDIPIAVGDAAKLRKLTGWEPQHQIRDMLCEILNRARAEVRKSKS